VEENVTKTGISLFAYISKNKIESESKKALQSIKMQEVQNNELQRRDVSVVPFNYFFAFGLFASVKSR
jgi:hypothetical protein